MSTGIKNGKLHTINIHTAKLIFLFLILTTLSVSGADRKSNKGWVIVIDAGHGGKDPGASGAVSHEKDIVLGIALKTGRYIEQNIKNVEVIYTRKNDTFVELRDRAGIANKNKADLFLSIHANWAKSKNVKGSETYVMGVAKDQQNLEVAMKENEVILLENDHSAKYENFDPNSEVSYIMFSLTQKVFQEQSIDLATKIQTEFRERVDRNDRDVKQAGFLVLFRTTMPSILIETGFITNTEEEKFLISQEGQDFLASAIFRACKDYINEIDSKSGFSVDSDPVPAQKNDSDKMPLINAGEIVFMVQIYSSASHTEIKPDNFNGLTDIIEIDAVSRYKYASGRFKEFSEAAKYRKKLQETYPDAFVIAVKDNKILPLQEALEQKSK